MSPWLNFLCHRYFGRHDLELGRFLQRLLHLAQIRRADERFVVLLGEGGRHLDLEADLFHHAGHRVGEMALDDADAAIIIGGDNGITRAGVHGLGLPLDKCGLITFDAHFDLRDLALGLTNGNPIRALLNDGLPGDNIVQMGIQGFANSRAYAEFAHDVGISVVTMGEIRRRDFETLVAGALAHLSDHVEAIYVDFDIDVLDRIFAPACPGSRPGGLTPWELKRAAFVCGQHPKVRAIDLVEVDPENDIAETTVLTTASCLLSFASGLAARLRKSL